MRGVWGDVAAYTRSDAGVTVDQGAGAAEGGHAEGDILVNIESVRGSDHDTLTARDEGSTLYGEQGDDILHGSDGDDYLFGGKGNDTLDGGEGGGHAVGRSR